MPASTLTSLIKNMSFPKHHLELLSPARDVTIAREAIPHGADAVYIGCPSFGSRHNACNEVSDIARLVEFAHRYNARSEEHTSELQSLMRISYAVFCLKKKTKHT